MAVFELEDDEGEDDADAEVVALEPLELDSADEPLELDSADEPLSPDFEAAAPSPDESDDERPLADADEAVRESVIYQPLPLKTMPTG